MGGEGSIQGMIVSYRQNRQLRRKKSMFARDRKFETADLNSYSGTNQELDIKKLSPEELNVFKERTIRSNRRTMWVRTAFLIMISIPLAIGLYAIAKSIISSNPNVIEVPKNDFEATKAEFEFFITDGDNWANQQKWENAIFQYENAIKLFPNNYIGNYRLARAYVFCCRENGDNCDEAIDFLNMLILNFPDKPGLFKLRAEHFLDKGQIELANKDFNKVDELNK
jgi:tetratricopeptide (TPR) repeat protein